MIKRTIEVSGKGNHLAIDQGSLTVRRDGEEVGRVPLEDLGVLVLDCPTTTYTHSVLTQALAAGAVVIPCGRDHLPRGLFLPQENALLTQRLLQQVLWVLVELPLRFVERFLVEHCLHRHLLLIPLLLPILVLLPNRFLLGHMPPPDLGASRTVS